MITFITHIINLCFIKCDTYFNKKKFVEPRLAALIQRTITCLSFFWGAKIVKLLINRHISSNLNRESRNCMLLELRLFYSRLINHLNSEKNRQAPMQYQIKTKSKIKVGFIGRLSTLCFASKKLFFNAPPGIEIYLYDHPVNGQVVSNYKSFCNYRTVLFERVDDSEKLNDIAKIINADKLDYLFTSNLGEKGGFIIDRLTVPSIIHWNITCFLQANLKCRVQVHGEIPWAYSVSDEGVIHNLNTGKDIPGIRLYCNTYHYNYRVFKDIGEVPFEKKRNQIITSGRLEKLDSEIMCQAIINLLKADRNLNFVFYGKDLYGNLENIIRRFRSSQVLGQVIYKGVYYFSKDHDGNLIDTASSKEAAKDLVKSKLYLNTFPWYAGNSIIEAYNYGIPVLHLSPSNADWIKNPEWLHFKMPYLLTKSGTAHTPQEYETLCHKVVNDESFAHKITLEQYDLLKNKLTNPDFFWKAFQKNIAHKQ